jgi:hypothetical protein
MSVYLPHHGRTWRYDFRADGKRFEGSTDETDRVAAQAFENRIREAARTDLKHRRQAATFARLRVKPRDYRIYFARCGRAIKIGRAVNVRQRVVQLQVGNPHRIRLLGSIAGSEYIEQEFHRVFGPHMIAGEWYFASPCVVESVRHVLKLHGHAKAQTRDPDSIDTPGMAILKTLRTLFPGCEKYRKSSATNAKRSHVAGCPVRKGSIESLPEEPDESQSA